MRATTRSCRGACRRRRPARALLLRAGAGPARGGSRAGHCRGRWHGTIVDAPRGERRVRLRPAFRRRRHRPDRRRAAAATQERAVASRPGDAGADREAGGARARSASDRSEPDRISRLTARPAAAVHGAAAARAVRAYPVVRAQVPVLRFQFARSARRRSGGRLRRCAAAGSRVRAARRLGTQGRQRLLWRRHAEPVFRGLRSTACSPGFARACRCCPTPRSRWKPIRARSSGRSSPASSPPASTAFRSASRASIHAQLKALGRVHDDEEARRAAEAALMIFGNVNFDLMYGVAAADGRRRAGRPCRGAGVRAAAPVVLSPDARAQHAVPSRSRRRCPTRIPRRTSKARCTRRSRTPATRTTKRRPTRSRTARAGTT